MNELELRQLKERLFEIMKRNEPDSRTLYLIQESQKVVDWIIGKPTDQDLKNILNDSE